MKQLELFSAASLDQHGRGVMHRGILIRSLSALQQEGARIVSQEEG